MNNTQNHRDQVISNLKSRNIRFDESIQEKKGASKFRNYVKKFMTVMRLKKPSVTNIKDHYKHNPLLFRFYSAIFLWLFATFLVHFILPMTSHNMKNKD